MILVEPGSMTREIFSVAFKEPTLLKQVMEMTRKGKDIWPSRDAALEWFSQRNPWKRWDPRVLRLFLVRAVVFLVIGTSTYLSHLTATLALRTSRSADGYISGLQGRCNPNVHPRAGGPVLSVL